VKPETPDNIRREIEWLQREVRLKEEARQSVFWSWRESEKARERAEASLNEALEAMEHDESPPWQQARAQRIRQQLIPRGGEVNATPDLVLGPPNLPQEKYRGADITEVLLHDRPWLSGDADNPAPEGEEKSPEDCSMSETRRWTIYRNADHRWHTQDVVDGPSADGEEVVPLFLLEQALEAMEKLTENEDMTYDYPREIAEADLEAQRIRQQLSPEEEK
jgi:hypothetical protein